VGNHRFNLPGILLGTSARNAKQPSPRRPRLRRRPRKRDFFMKSTRLLGLLAFAIIVSSVPQALAADRSINTNACMSGNQGQPNAVAKCQAAGQRSAKTGVYVGPFDGQTYQGGNCGRYGSKS
jgi:hypothetical protein